MSNGIVLPRHRKLLEKSMKNISMKYAVSYAIREAKSKNDAIDATDLANVAIVAIRDFRPTKDMMSAMWSLKYSNTKESFEECWRAMIDAGVRDHDNNK